MHAGAKNLLYVLVDAPEDRTQPALPESALDPAPVLFDRVNVLTFEEGAPDSKLTGSVDWTMGPFGATLRATRYGEVLSPGTTAAQDLELKAATLVDVEARWNVTEMVRVSVGADNVFDD